MVIDSKHSKPLLLTLLSLISVSGSTARADAPKFEIYGFAQSDYIQDFRRVDPAWEDTLRPSKIPTIPGLYGSDVQSSISAKQSRFGVKTNQLVEGHDLYTQLEFDFFGVGVDAGQTTIRLRHAYGKWGQWLAGQTHSLFMDIDMFPNIIDYWGPCGMAFLRNPQIRWTPISGSESFAIAIEKPSADVDAGNIREVDPGLGAAIQADETLPDLSAQFRTNRPWGHFQLGALLRRLGYDTPDTTANQPKGHTVGWGFDASSNIKLGGDLLLLSVIYGQGIASYMNDGGTDLAPEGVPGSLTGKAVPLLGISAYYQHNWNKRFSSVIGYARTQVDNTSFQSGSAFKTGQYASTNLLMKPGKNMLVGAEILWGRLDAKSGASGTDVRSQITFKYDFTSLDFERKSP